MAVAPTLTERLTAAFYDWEHRGRGWLTWPQPVELEPPYRASPFVPVASTPSRADDGRRPTFLSSLVKRFRSRGESSAVERDALPAEVWEPEPAYYDGALWPVTELALSLPPDQSVSREVAEKFLLSLTACHHPVSFEVVGLPEAIVVQLAARKGDVGLVSQQLRAHFPDIGISEESSLLTDRWQRAAEGASLVIDFGLSQEFMRPLRMAQSLEPDPLVAVVGALSDVQAGEMGVLQVLFAPARERWADSAMEAVTDWRGGSFFADAPEMVALARRKVERPLFAALVRVAARGPREDRVWSLARGLGGALRQLADPASNELMPLSEDAYDHRERAEDLLHRQTRRSGMLLNSLELVALVHPPSASVRSDKLARDRTKTKRVPEAATGHGMLLGENMHAGTVTPVTLSATHRLRHTHLVGASGTGKSHLLLQLILQDLAAGSGLAVLDPHGDLIDHVLERIPEERLDDVVVFDPADPTHVVGFNVLEAGSALEKDLLASDLTAVFKRLATSWGDRMTAVLSNAVLAFLESEEGGTLADLRRFLVDTGYRKAFLESVTDPEIVFFWEKEFPLLSGRPQAPILTRLNAFLRHRLVRHTVAQRNGGLDLGAVMEEGKVLFIKLAEGQIGHENAYLLGSLLLARFHQLTLARQEQAASERRPFSLYVDEFHHFATPSMAAILAGARKYRLGLTLAHQDLEQLRRRDTELLAAVLTNPATRVCFRVGDQDAKKLAEGFASFDASDLQRLGVGEAICRVERADWDFNLRTLPLPPIDTAAARERRESAERHSRNTYAMRRAEIEAALRRARPAADTDAAAVEQPQEAQATQEESRSRSAPSADAEAAPRPPKEKETPPPPAPTAPPSVGRGGPQHTYLQELIQRWAQAHDWRVSIEAPVLDGLGAVDVALERGEVRVACEVTVTTTPEHELANVQKCLAAGFEHVVLVAPERKRLNRLRRYIASELEESNSERVHFLTPEELFAFLEERLAEEAAGDEQTVRGYRVKLRYQPVDEQEKEARRKAISKVILDAVKRLRGPES